MSRSPATSSVYDIKSADLPLVAFQLKSTDMQAVAHALAAQLQETPDFFNQDPALIDLDGLSADEGDIDFSVLLKVLQTHGLKPVAIKSGQRDWLDAALRAGLVVADDARIRRQAPAAISNPEPVIEPVPAAPTLSQSLVLNTLGTTNQSRPRCVAANALFALRCRTSSTPARACSHQTARCAAHAPRHIRFQK